SRARTPRKACRPTTSAGRRSSRGGDRRRLWLWTEDRGVGGPGAIGEHVEDAAAVARLEALRAHHLDAQEPREQRHRHATEGGPLQRYVEERAIVLDQTIPAVHL